MVRSGIAQMSVERSSKRWQRGGTWDSRAGWRGTALMSFEQWLKGIVPLSHPLGSETAGQQEPEPSHPLHVTIHHALLARLVELDDELVAVDGGDVAVAEFLVEHAVADREVGDGAGRLGDQLGP